MQPIPVSLGDETLLIPRLRVQELIDLSTLRHDRERRELLQDLEAAGIEPEAKLEALREHRKSRGLSSVIVRAAFTVEGAWSILRVALADEIPEELKSLDPTTLSRTALACIGIDLDELAGDGTGSAEGKASTSLETGSPSPRSSSSSIQDLDGLSISASTSSTIT